MIARNRLCYENLKFAAESGKVSENLAKLGDRVKSGYGVGQRNWLSTGSQLALKPPKTQKTRRTPGTSRLAAQRSFLPGMAVNYEQSLLRVLSQTKDVEFSWPDDEHQYPVEPAVVP